MLVRALLARAPASGEPTGAVGAARGGASLLGVLGGEVHVVARGSLRARRRVGVEPPRVAGVHHVQHLVADVRGASAHLEELAHLVVDHPGVGRSQQPRLDQGPQPGLGAGPREGHTDLGGAPGGGRPPRLAPPIGLRLDLDGHRGDQRVDQVARVRLELRRVVGRRRPLVGQLEHGVRRAGPVRGRETEAAASPVIRAEPRDASHAAALRDVAVLQDVAAHAAGVHQHLVELHFERLQDLRVAVALECRRVVVLGFGGCPTSRVQRRARGGVAGRTVGLGHELDERSDHGAALGIVGRTVVDQLRAQLGN